MLLRAALPLLLLASCASQPEEPEMKIQWMTPPRFMAPGQSAGPNGSSTVVLDDKQFDSIMPRIIYISPWPEMTDLQKAAADGIPAAIFELGDAYELGLEVKQDLPKALELYRAAAATGHRKSIVRLGEKSHVELTTSVSRKTDHPQ